MDQPSGGSPHPVRGGKGADDPGPRDVVRDREDPDMLAPPETEHGSVPNLKFSFADAHNRLEPGGWAREVTECELPIAKQLAGVNMRLKAGAVRIADGRNFPANQSIAAALVDVEPGGVRELHWHPNNDEWQYYIEGQARMTVFASGGKARTFDYRAGDVGYVPFAMGHYIENTGSTTVRYLEMFKSARFQDMSLKQWMAVTPHELVQQHLHIDRGLLDSLPQQKTVVMPGNPVNGPMNGKEGGR